MYLLGLGILLMVLKLLGAAPVADWSWWGVLLPFPLASLWWTVADLTGYTKRRAAERELQRRLRQMRRHLAQQQKSFR
ncbi:TIGR04438 family Trp-rich protein [Ramlibacter sp. AW1]|uniref:TIGR04438 family Trp-rich protein n=1 Tax=Ramlibacter aurantiacus TaxID=2801330 RepID=A0A936ZN13_9BURK|nr:TIGR04438 family Trp-rich protein [Ramlibacter aurantiacus]MBL0420303.1 TIGR04438 family Trp-rich protein [Ramlibacter aurantiacus]